MPALPTRSEAIVIGAGLAGLAAARTLTDAGVETLVLEAADAPGGRVRTDVVDGMRLDRGFQVYNTAYPEAARVLDHAALDLKPFTPGALVRLGPRLHRVADPRRRPGAAWRTWRAPVGSPADKVRLGVLSAQDAVLPVQRLLDRPETTTYEALRARGLSEEVVDTFIRPFLSGVFCESDLTTSSRFFDVVWRSFARGQQCVPAAGMQAIPDQLAGALPAGCVRLSIPVRAVRSDAVETDSGTVSARVVVVATDARTAATLLPGLPSPRSNSVTTYYHRTSEAPLDEPVIVLDGEHGGPVANTVVLTAAAPGYAPAGTALVSSSVVGPVDLAPDEPTVREELARLYGVDTRDWEHVATAPVPHALPDQSPPLGRLRRPVRLQPGRYVAGDHRDSASIQGALVSGRRAAGAALHDLQRGEA